MSQKRKKKKGKNISRHRQYLSLRVCLPLFFLECLRVFFRKTRTKWKENINHNCRQLEQHKHFRDDNRKTHWELNPIFVFFLFLFCWILDKGKKGKQKATEKQWTEEAMKIISINKSIFEQLLLFHSFAKTSV